MDLQGQPIPSGARGVKNTTDPEAYRNPIVESSGPVANDSLAAESSKSGGAFSQNRGAEPLGVSGNQSTFANQDTSGATTLSSAPDRTARPDPTRKQRYPEALGGQGEFPGTHLPESGYAGGSTQAKQGMGIHAGEYPASQKLQSSETSGGDGGAAASGSGYTQYHSEYNAGTAPNYITPATSNLGNTKPKGNKLTEGGFPDEPGKNVSFTSEIGSQQDPGRLAETKFQRMAQESGPYGTEAGRQKGVDSDNLYGSLKRDQRA
ncbi:hypothetical protein ASPZODRAFT_58079 [Penicilliopsis zonata CBS 506.65]|uniref:Uncharacterized protein n=1 Tax=Penicilliopsis zonata CBS 506.65 TaxID=1073090 RepID=A0A1L9SRY8_9EURO|nr:hypothetical protein ASPZODRAFT_58079 [Penicilliopsis zonata CBS 506.65]OJJ49969.1 hypothetical protein ASPZODRAFT_58079 [Penicilliopsis zonata CBS 506.65]